MSDPMRAFLEARPVAVVGASTDRAKYGNIVLRNLRQRGWPVFAVNPREPEIEGQPAYASLAECPELPGLAVVVTPPAVALKIVEQAAAVGVKRVWLQPGAESADVINRAAELGVELIHNACIMVMASRGSG
jgi:predicted CoA-binding protein